MPVQTVDPNPPGYVDATTLSSGNYGKPFILTKVFDLLVLMIDVLQRTAAAQANRLNILTEWQKAYTDELNQVHAFVESNGDQEGTLLSAGYITSSGSVIGAPNGEEGAKLPEVQVPTGSDIPNLTSNFAGNNNQNGSNNIPYISDKATNPAQSDSVADAPLNSDPNLKFLYSGSGSQTPVSIAVVNAGASNEYYEAGSSGSYYTWGTSNSKGAIDGSSTAAINARAGLTTTNSTYTQQIQGNLNVVSNDSKTLQANINQSNDAVQSQSDMATAILQQMSTILTAIFQAAT